MLWIPGGTFLMGSDDHYPEEAPAHRVGVDGFWMDRCPVTNADFQQFVDETGYVTLAELPPPDPALYPQQTATASSRVGGFVKPKKRTDGQFCTGWQFVIGADWRHPLGPDSSLAGLGDHPADFMCPTLMRKLMQSGPGKNCRPRLSGNLLHVAVSIVLLMPGVTTYTRTVITWQTHGKESFPGKICAATGLKERRPSALSLRTDTGCWTPSEMFGNGWRIGISTATQRTR